MKRFLHTFSKQTKEVPIMSRSWTPEELAKASEAMKAAGHLGYEEFCEALKAQETNRQRLQCH